MPPNVLQTPKLTDNLGLTNPGQGSQSKTEIEKIINIHLPANTGNATPNIPHRSPENLAIERVFNRLTQDNKYFTQLHLTNALKQLAHNKPEAPSSEAKNRTAGNIILGATFLGIHVDQIIRTHCSTILPASLGCAIVWNLFSLYFLIKDARHAYNQKQYKQMAAFIFSAGLLGSSSVGSVLTYSGCQVVFGLGAVAINAFANFAFVAYLGLAFSMQLGHLHGACKRRQSYKRELLRLEKEKATNPTDHTIEEDINATRSLIAYETSLIKEHKKQAIVYGAATVCLTGLATLGLLVTLGLISGISLSVVSAGIIPAALAVICLGLTLWSHYHKSEKINLPAPPIQKSKPSRSTPAVEKHEGNDTAPTNRRYTTYRDAVLFGKPTSDKVKQLTVMDTQHPSALPAQR